MRNPGNLVEQYRLQVLGDANGWTQLVPREVSTVPGRTEGEKVQVVFRPPPAPAAPAGEIPFGIRCVSLERPDDVAVIEGDIAVSAVLDIQASIGPEGGRGADKGRFAVRLFNSGTLPVTVRVWAVDDAELLRLAVAPPEATVEARAETEVYVSARPRATKIFGKPVEHPVIVGYEIPGTERAGELRATYRQHALVRRWMIVVAILLVVVALIVGVFVVLRPGADPGPPLSAGAPPALSPPPTVEAVQPDAATISWDANPYATGYLILYTNGLKKEATPAPIPAPTTTFVWKDLPGSGEFCFQVVPVNGNGRGTATDPTCIQLQGTADAAASAAAESESAASQSAADSAAASASAQAVAESSAAAAAEASSSAAEASSQAASQSSAAGQFRPRQFWVTYYRTDSLLDVAAQVQAALIGAGVQAQLVNSASMPPPLNAAPLWMVISDNYPTEAAAKAECTARAAIPNVICVPNAPIPPA